MKKVSDLTVTHEPMGRGGVMVARWLENGEEQLLYTIASRTPDGDSVVEAGFLEEMEIRLGLKPEPKRTEVLENAIRYQEEWRRSLAERRKSKWS